MCDVTAAFDPARLPGLVGAPPLPAPFSALIGCRRSTQAGTSIKTGRGGGGVGQGPYTGTVDYGRVSYCVRHSGGRLARNCALSTVVENTSFN